MLKAAACRLLLTRWYTFQSPTTSSTDNQYNSAALHCYNLPT
jgi:hypothetical protein